VNAIENPLSGLKHVLRKPHEAFQGFGSGFTELQKKLDTHCSMLPSIADKKKHEVEKALV
jgi:hypothetical protein